MSLSEQNCQKIDSHEDPRERAHFKLASWSLVNDDDVIMDRSGTAPS